MEERGDNNIITYESLFEALRREKAKEELQKLDFDFYKKIKRYIAEKSQARLVNVPNDVFLEIERENIERQITNIKKLVKELFERREKKIINMALNKSRINNIIIDTSCLLEEEVPFFEALLNVFNNAKQTILINTLSPEIDSVSKEKEEKEKLTNDSNIEISDSKTKNLKSSAQSQEDETKKESGNSGNVATVRMLCNVQAFVGPNIETYGPFEENEVVQLPEEVCTVLINTGKAVKIKNEDSKNSNEVLSLL